MPKKDDSSKFIFNTFVVLICVTLFFIMIISNFALKINDGAICERTNLDNFKNKNIVETDYILNSNTSYVISSFEFEDQDVLMYEVCFRGEVVTNDGAKVNIINSNKEVLSYFYLLEGNSTKCVLLNNSKIKPYEYLGVLCENCNSTNTIRLLEQAGAPDVDIIFYNTINEVYLNDNPIYLVVNSLSDCKKSVREFTFYYFTILFFIGLGLLVIVGYNAFYERLKDW